MFDLFRPRRSVCTCARSRVHFVASLRRLVRRKRSGSQGCVAREHHRRWGACASRRHRDHHGTEHQHHLFDGRQRVRLLRLLEPEGRHLPGRAELSGFKKTVREDIASSQPDGPRRLEDGGRRPRRSRSRSSARRPLLQTDRADTGPHHRERAASAGAARVQSQLPGDADHGAGRDASVQRPHSEFFNAQDSLSTNVNGQSRLANNVQIEGIDDNHRTGLLTTLIPSAEAIETVNISTSAYDAEFGRPAARSPTSRSSRAPTVSRAASSPSATTRRRSAGLFLRTRRRRRHTCRAASRSADRSGTTGCSSSAITSTPRDHAGRTTRATIPPMAYQHAATSARRRRPFTIRRPATRTAPDGRRSRTTSSPPDRISPIAKAILANLPAPNIDAALGADRTTRSTTRA